MKKILEGCSILFHGNVETAALTKTAIAMGARVTTTIRNATHLVTDEAMAANPDDDMVKKAMKSSLWIVNSTWVTASQTHLARADETQYMFDILRHQARFEELIHAATVGTTTVQQLADIETFYRQQVKKEAVIYTELSKSEGRRVLKLLTSILGDKTDSTVRPQLTDVAKKAMHVFFYFVQTDRGFQRAVEQLSPSELARALKLERHLEDHEVEHQQLTAACVTYLMRSYHRFEELAVYLRTDQARESLDIRKPAMQEQAKRESLDGKLPPEGRYYDQEVEAVREQFKSDFAQGLTSAEAAARVQKYGTNELPQIPPTPWWKMLLLQFADFLMIVLMVVGVVSLGLQKWIEGAVLWAVVIANAIIGFIQEMNAEAKLSALKNLIVQTATVIRDGQNVDIPTKNVVPGDIVVLQEGGKVPADLRMFEAQQLRVLEAQLTGEPEPIKKTTKVLLEKGLKEGDQTNMCFVSRIIQCSNVARFTNIVYF